MADQSEVDRVLAENYARAGQGLNTLAASVPDAGPETLRSRLTQGHEWLTQNVLHPAQYAGLYPVRVLDRLYPNWPVSAEDKPSRVGLRRRMGEGDKHGGPLPVNEIDAMGTYTPGERQSDMVEDRRPKSPWEYADGGEVDRILSQYGQVRDGLYSGEDAYFKANPNVTGMAADDNKVILNPYANAAVNKDAVRRNESFRLFLRDKQMTPDFSLTPEQRNAFKGTPYDGNDAALRETIAARIYSGDPSALATPEQEAWVQQTRTGYADGGEVDRVLAQYGQGYTSPALNSGDGETLDTAGILGQYTRRNEGLPGVLRGWAGNVRDASRPDNVLAGGLDTAANWIAGEPQVGQDTLAPLGLGIMGSMLAPANAAGIFGGRLARTADREALSRAEEMAGRGMPRETIWDQTGWFQGRDGQWRFEINDANSAFRPEPITPHERNVRGDVQVADHFDHPGLYAAYPELAQARFSVEAPQGALGSYDPSTRTIAVSREASNVPGGQRTVALHELQHAVPERFAPGASHETFQQQREAQLARDALSFRREIEAANFGPGVDWIAKENAIIDQYRRLGAMDWVPSREARDLASDYHNNPNAQLSELVRAYGLDQRTTPRSPMDMYFRTAGEVEARNVETRRDFSPEARRTIPPWQSQDVPDADQILRQYSSGPQMSVPSANERWIADYRAEGTLRPEHTVTESTMPMANFNGRDIRASQTTVDPRGVRYWEKQIKDGARPAILLEQTPDGFRIVDGHTRATAYSHAGITDVPVLIRQSGDAPAGADDVLRQYSQGPQVSARNNEDLSYLLGPRSRVGVIGEEVGTVRPNGVSALNVRNAPEGYGGTRLVYTRDGQIVGAMQVMRTPNGPPMVANTYVAPEFRRSGIATELNRAAEEMFGRLERSEGPSEAGEAFRQSLRRP